MTTIRTERDDRGAIVWFQMPWTLQREALWLFAIVTLTFALMQPTPMRMWAIALAAVLLVVHAVIGPDDRKDRCGI